MAYRRYRSYLKPTPRNMAVKFAGSCACCGATIKAGELATYYPAGTIAGISAGRIAHIGGLDGNSAKCSGIIKAAYDAAANDFAGDGLDSRYEDECARNCGL
jgi:hypothetical protein